MASDFVTELLVFSEEEKEEKEEKEERART
jgi:hypothetical protein